MFITELLLVWTVGHKDSYITDWITLATYQLECNVLTYRAIPNTLCCIWQSDRGTEERGEVFAELEKKRCSFWNNVDVVYMLFSQHPGPNLENWSSVWYWPKRPRFWRKGHQKFHHPLFKPFSKCLHQNKTKFSRLDPGIWNGTCKSFFQNFPILIWNIIHTNK